MRRLSYTLIRVSVSNDFEFARAVWLCDCGAQTVIEAPDGLSPPACVKCDIAFRRFLSRSVSTTFKAKDFKTLPAG